MTKSAKRPSMSDFDSPGYEYLRSYQNMSNLYNKLVVLNYQQDFCPSYKCPPIHRYYFTTPSKNLEEQQYLFTCLCAWLIKDKCQMNLDLEPEEYEDPNIIVGVIFEALCLLLLDEEDTSTRGSRKKAFGFPPGRLKQGFGPEVIWALNVLADRAMELIVESEPNSKRTIKFVYNDKKSADSTSRAGSGSSAANNFITVGQPFVGGGLTTRPLGSYQIDDENLLFDDDSSNPRAELQPVETDKTELQDSINANDWYDRVRRAEHLLRDDRRKSNNEVIKSKDLQDYLDSMMKSKREIDDFLRQSKPTLEEVQMRIDRQMEVIGDREKSLQTKLRSQIDEFLKIWRNYSSELGRHKGLSEQVNAKTDDFESYNERLRGINTQIEMRIKELNDGSKLRELESMINRLNKESAEFDVKIGLLLSVYPTIQNKIVSSSSSHQH